MGQDTTLYSQIMSPEEQILDKSWC